MSWLDGLARRLGYVPAARSTAGGYDMAQVGRLLNDWVLSATTADQNIRRDLRGLRNRSRDLAENEVYLQRFFRMLLRNVVGAQGIRLAMDVRTAKGEPDEDANGRIEEAWRNWAKTGICTSCGTLSWWEVERLVLHSVARDGDMLLHHEFGFENDFGYAVQLLEGDLLDHELNEDRPGGRRIKLGVEVNQDGRPLAYHLLRRHPGDLFAQSLGTKHNRVPANEIIHPFVRHRITQTRGVPWVNATGKNLRHLNGFSEAAVVAARTGASKMGFITSEATSGDYSDGKPKDGLGRPVEEVEPGMLEALAPGQDFKAFDPGYPNGEFGDFVKAILRGVACGLDVSYASLAGDLSDANYSSMREGKGDEQDAWRDLQRWLTTKLHQPVGEQWLRFAILTGQINLPMGKLDTFLAGMKWRPRGWAPVDEKKSADANEKGLANRTITREQISSAAGREWRDDFDQLKREQDYADKIGLREPRPSTAAQPAPASSDDDDKD